MPWENCTVESARLQLIKSYLHGKETMSTLCAQHGVSRKTAYKWVHRYQIYGEDGLKDLSRAPHKPFRIYAEEIFSLAINMKCRYPKWGPKKILDRLEKYFPEVEHPSKSRLYQLFKAQGLTTPRRIRRRVPATNPLADVKNCNDTWAIDFKGWFLTKNGEKCEPLTITDCHSRFLLKCIHAPRKTEEFVWDVLEKLFKTVGLPKKIRSDNGPPFATTGTGRFSKLSIKLIKAGVIPEWINPGHPEENGTHERFHETLKLEAASPPANNLKEQIEEIEEFQEIYNYERPHESLDMKTPSECYAHSDQIWTGKFQGPQYNADRFMKRMVCHNGCLSLYGNYYHIGKALCGETIGLEPFGDNNYKMYFGPIYLGEISSKGFIKPKLNSKKRRK